MQSWNSTHHSAASSIIPSYMWVDHYIFFLIFFLLKFENGSCPFQKSVWQSQIDRDCDTISRHIHFKIDWGQNPHIAILVTLIVNDVPLESLDQILQEPEFGTSEYYAKANMEVYFSGRMICNHIACRWPTTSSNIWIADHNSVWFKIRM